MRLPAFLSHCSGCRIPKLVLVIIPIFLAVAFVLDQELLSSTMRSQHNSLMALVAALAGHAQAAATVDLSWHAPNATEINDLSKVIAGDGVYGFVYNSSDVPAEKYGTYNWCNMPHVRATEYKKASSEYKLQYVEVVSSRVAFQWYSFSNTNTRSNAIINARCMRRTPSQSNHMDGTATIKVCSTMDSPRTGKSRPIHIGRVISLPSIHSCLRAF